MGDSACVKQIVEKFPLGSGEVLGKRRGRDIQRVGYVAGGRIARMLEVPHLVGVAQNLALAACQFRAVEHDRTVRLRGRAFE